MRLVNLVRIFCYSGVSVGCGIAPISMAHASFYADEFPTQSPLELALEAMAKLQVAPLSYPMTTPFLMKTPKGHGRASMLKFVAKGNTLQAVTALSMAAMASATTQCVSLTYDKNGNRLSQTGTSMAESPVIWGGGAYGCFVWAS